MRVIHSLVFLTILSMATYGQTIKKSYFNLAWQEVNGQNGYTFYSTINKYSNLYKLTGYYSTGEMLMSGYFLDSKFEKKNGEFIWYFKNGNVKQRQSYNNGKPYGDLSYYYLNGNLFRTETEIDKSVEIKTYYENGSQKFEGRYFNNMKKGEMILYQLNSKKYIKAQFDEQKNSSECGFFEEDGVKLNSYKCNIALIEQYGCSLNYEDPFAETGQGISVNELQQYSSNYKTGIEEFKQGNYLKAAYGLEKAASILADTTLLIQVSFAYKKVKNTSKYVYFLCLASMYGSKSAHADIVKSFDYLTNAKLDFKGFNDKVTFDAEQMAYTMRVRTLNGEYKATKLMNGATEYRPINSELFFNEIFENPSEFKVDTSSNQITFTSSQFKSDNTLETYEVVEVMPEYPGGMLALQKFIATNIKYPRVASQLNKQGSVIVTFVLNELGEITNPEVVKSVGGGCDEEAIRVIKLLQNWKPGMQNGKPVKVQFTVPIKFSLN